MKKLLLTIGISITLLSCSERGEVKNKPTDFISIHGKIYKLVRIVPCDDCRGIWIIYPKDSSDAQPEIINYDDQSGKTTYTETVIKLD